MPSCRPPATGWRLLRGLALAAPALLVLAAAAPAAGPTAAPAGTLVVTKLDPQGQGLPDAVFQIHMPDGSVRTVKTGADGSTPPVTVVQPGRYCVVETVPPPGYQPVPPSDYTPKGGCVSVAPEPPPTPVVFTVTVTDPPVATPSPTPTATPTPTPTPTPPPTPSPSPTAPPSGELQVVKTDSAGHGVTTPGFTFNVHTGSASGQVIASITTDGSGTAVAAALSPATYCLEETAAPDGYQVAPTYSPGACVQVAVDTNQGHSPTTVTVADPASGTPSPPAAAGPTSPESTQRPIPRLLTPPGGSAGGLLAGRSLAAGLVGFGGLLLLLGTALIVAGLRRRRRLQPVYEPPDTWYDSTIR